MGMDVEGINPVVRGTKPERPDDLFELSDEAKDKYFDALNTWYDVNPGDYFRANVWGWRPLCEIMWESGACYEMPTKEWDGMAYNDGHGAENQEQCNRMVAKLKSWMMEKIWDDDGTYTPEAFKKEDMLVCAETGTFVRKAEAELKGIDTRSPYRVSKERVEDWIAFLSECGGFKVW